MIFNQQLSDKVTLSQTAPFQQGLLYTLPLFFFLTGRRENYGEQKDNGNEKKNTKLVFCYLVLCFLQLLNTTKLLDIPF